MNTQRLSPDIVIDIETLGTGADCVIVSIGAAIFNRADAPGVILDSFDVKLDIENQPGRHIDPGTMLWWMKKSMNEARKAAFSSMVPRVRLGLALKQLDDFIKFHKPNEAWGCSPSFDMVILQDAYKQHKQPFPVPFWKWSCIRTIESFFYGKNTRKPDGENWLDGTAHDALDDCKMEASVIQKCHRAAVKAGVSV